MAADDAKARKARAASIHSKIESLKKPATGSKKPPPADETPSEFVHRRMGELDCGPGKPKSK